MINTTNETTPDLEVIWGSWALLCFYQETCDSHSQSLFNMDFWIPEYAAYKEVSEMAETGSDLLQQYHL